MSNIKRWILAILLVVAFAGYLTIFGVDGGSGECLKTFLYPSTDEPARRLAGSINMPLTHLEGGYWGVQDGETVLFIVDTAGNGFISRVCMTGDFTNPYVEFIQ